MSGRPFSIPGRVVYLLICMAVIVTLTGCEIPVAGLSAAEPVLSAEDLQHCADMAKEILYLGNANYEMVPPLSNIPEPGPPEIISPASGVLYFGPPVVIEFKQPPGDAGYGYRQYEFMVGNLLTDYYDSGDPAISVIHTLSPNVKITWTPPSPGKFLLMILIRNLETTGPPNPSLQGVERGRYSSAYVCVKIEPPNTKTPQPKIIVPLEYSTLTPTSTIAPKIIIPLEYLTPTFTLTPTRTPSKTPTLTPSATSTLTPSKTPTLTPSATFTLTFTLTPSKTPTRTPIKPTVTSTFTSEPPPSSPTAAVNCSAYLDQPSCERDQACFWENRVCKNKP